MLEPDFELSELMVEQRWNKQEHKIGVASHVLNVLETMHGA